LFSISRTAAVPEEPEIVMNQDNPLPDETGNSKYSTPAEFWTVFFLCLFLGVFGAHRFYAKKWQTGLVQLFTCGGLGIWVLIDLLLILVDAFRNEQGVFYKNPNQGLSWAIFLVAVGLSVYVNLNDYNQRHPSNRRHIIPAHLDLGGAAPPPAVTNSPIQQMIINTAHDKFGNRIVVEVAGPDTNQVYQVTVRGRDRYGAIKTETFNVTLDPAGQKVVSWQ